MDGRPGQPDDYSPAPTPLGWVCNRRHGDVARTLLEAGADPDAPDRRGNTPLHLTPPDVPELWQLLLDAGADLSRTNQDGYTPSEEARRQAEAFETPPHVHPDRAAAERAKAEWLEAAAAR